MKKLVIAEVLLLAVLLLAVWLNIRNADSANPTDPTEPTGSHATEPSSPTDPTEPSDPTKPSDPTDPTDVRGDPTEPSQTNPTQPNNEGVLPGHDPVDGSYFDDAVFIGDSVSLKLSYYEAAMNKLGKAQFLVAGSLGSGNALWKVSNESVHPVYNGQKMLLEESVPLTGAKKLYIMLGMNDIAVYGIQGSVDNMVKLLNRILAEVPDIEIFIQSMTPIAEESNIVSKNGLNNDKVRQYNALLLETAKQKGWNFVDVASAMYDSEGYLREDYCSDYGDMGVHFTNAGCQAWVDYLLTHTK